MRKTQTAVFALGEVEIRRKDINLPAISHKTFRHFKLTGMPWQVGGIGKLINQPEASIAARITEKQQKEEG